METEINRLKTVVSTNLANIQNQNTTDPNSCPSPRRKSVAPSNTTSRLIFRLLGETVTFLRLLFVQLSLKVAKTNCTMDRKISIANRFSRTHSFELKPNHRPNHSIHRTCSASYDSTFSGDEEFSRKIQELVHRFQFSDENCTDSASESEAIRTDTPDWNPTSIEMKANSVNLPISLRMIKQKKMSRENWCTEKMHYFAGVETDDLGSVCEKQGFRDGGENNIFWRDSAPLITAALHRLNCKNLRLNFDWNSSSDICAAVCDGDHGGRGMHEK